MRISDWSSDVCSSDLRQPLEPTFARRAPPSPCAGRSPPSSFRNRPTTMPSRLPALRTALLALCVLVAACGPREAPKKGPVEDGGVRLATQEVGKEWGRERGCKSVEI